MIRYSAAWAWPGGSVDAACGWGDIDRSSPTGDTPYHHQNLYYHPRHCLWPQASVNFSLCLLRGHHLAPIICCKPSYTYQLAYPTRAQTCTMSTAARRRLMRDFKVRCESNSATLFDTRRPGRLSLHQHASHSGRMFPGLILLQRMQTDPPAGVSASPVADNVMTWCVKEWSRHTVVTTCFRIYRCPC